MGGSGSYVAAYPELLAVATHRARRVLGDDSDAAEVAQDALLRAFVAWDDISSYAPQWVSRVAVNLAISRLRQRRRVWPDSLAIPDGDTGVDAQIDLGRAVAALPLRQRQVVVLRHLADLPEREVAEMLGISSGSVKRHLHRALATLRSPASGLAAAYSVTEVSKGELMVTPWRTRHEPAVEPAGGWPTRPWDHRYFEDEESVVRVAVDQSGSVVLDAEGDEVQSGPGFDYEVAKVRRGRTVPHRETTAVPVDRLEPAMLEILERAGRMGEVFGHSWIGTEHLALALVERSSEARDIVGLSWAALAQAVAETYEGPYATARMELVNKRLATGWVPTPLDAEVAPVPNWALRQLLQRASELAGGEGRPQATLRDVAHQVVAPSPIEWPDGTRRTTPTFVSRLLDQPASTGPGQSGFTRSGGSVMAGLDQRVRPPERIDEASIGCDMAVDLGTANTLIYVAGRGIILDEPSVVSINVRTGGVLGFGNEATLVVGSTAGHIQALRPLRHGAIADLETCAKMLQYFINRARPATFGDGQRMAICVPSGLTAQEKAALQEAAELAGALSSAYLIEAPIAAAMGAGMPVHQPIGNMVVDIGRGAIHAAVISLGSIVSSHKAPTGGDDMDHAIQNYLRKEHAVLVGQRTAEEVKITLGSASLLEAELKAEVQGRDPLTGFPTTVATSTAEIREAISGQVGVIVGAVRVTLDKTPPEFAADIIEQGIVLTGGGALLNGLDVRLNNETGMRTVVAENPLHSVVLGGARFLKEL